MIIVSTEHVTIRRRAVDFQRKEVDLAPVGREVAADPAEHGGALRGMEPEKQLRKTTTTNRIGPDRAAREAGALSGCGMLNEVELGKKLWKNGRCEQDCNFHQKLLKKCVWRTLFRQLRWEKIWSITPHFMQSTSQFYTKRKSGSMYFQRHFLMRLIRDATEIF